MRQPSNLSLNLNVRGLEESPTLAINARCRERQAKGRRTFNLGLGQSPFPVPEPVVEGLRRHAAEKDYLPVHGLAELREAVASYHRRLDGFEVGADDVLVGPGSKELMFLLQLAFYGEIIIPTPCWVSYVPQARIIGREVKLLPTRAEDRWGLTAQQLSTFLEQEQDTFRPRLLVLNYPSNPHGQSYTHGQLEALAEVAREYQLLLLSDEIYGQLHFEGDHCSISRFYPEGTIVSSGLSKWCGAGGWRLGTFTFSPQLRWLQKAMACVASETYTSVSAPIQYAAVEAFRANPAIEDYLQHARRVLRALTRHCVEILRQARIRVLYPDGGFYLYADFSPRAKALARRGIHDGRALCAQLLDDVGVAVLPAEAFERPETELAARLALVNFDGAAALTASAAVTGADQLGADFVERHCLDTLRACNRIAEWVDGLL